MTSDLTSDLISVLARFRSGSADDDDDEVGSGSNLMGDGALLSPVWGPDPPDSDMQAMGRPRITHRELYV